jgi:hypothetical protein
MITTIGAKEHILSHRPIWPRLKPIKLKLTPIYKVLTSAENRNTPNSWLLTNNLITQYKVSYLTYNYIAVQGAFEILASFSEGNA